MNDSKISGIWPALLIPVDEKGNPEYSEIEKLVAILLNESVDGLYILGSTGQGFLFSEEQRNLIAKRVLEITQSKIPVIVQVGALNTNESVRLAVSAQKDGAYGISSVSPIYYSLNTDRIFDHYHAIGASVDIPFFPYHIGNQSIFTNGNAKEYVERVLAIPNAKGMKLTTQNLYEIGLISNFSKERLLLFSGADELMCQAAMCGTVGAIGSFYNIWAKECKKVRSGFLEGKVKQASEFMLIFQQIIYRVLPNPWSFMNTAMKLKYGVKIGLPNHPLGFGQAEWKEVEVVELMHNLEDFVKENFE